MMAPEIDPSALEVRSVVSFSRASARLFASAIFFPSQAATRISFHNSSLHTTTVRSSDIT
jgi:hypothetical protein